jgi:hypothetical protein
MSIPIQEYSGTAYKVIAGTFYDATAPDAVIMALETARARGARVRLFIGDPATGKAWQEEYDVCGRVSRTMGPVKAPLLINNARSLGGGIIGAAHVVAVMTAPGCFLYKHPTFYTGTFKAVASDMPEYKSAAIDAETGGIIARFKHETGARRWVDFMHGARMCK